MDLRSSNNMHREEVGAKRRFSGPIYLQVAEMVRQSITGGDFRRGVPLPSEHDLARAFSVSVGTMRKAMSHLVDDGFIYRSRGRGTFICEHRLRRRHGELTNASGSTSCVVRRHTIESRSAGKEDAGRLGIDEGVRIWSIERYLEDPGFYRSLQQAKIIGSVFPFGVDADALSRLELTEIMQLGKSPIGSIEERLHAIAADAETADVLSVAPGQPLLRVQRQFFDRGGVIVGFDERTILQQDTFYAFSGTLGATEPTE